MCIPCCVCVSTSEVMVSPPVKSARSSYHGTTSHLPFSDRSSNALANSTGCCLRGWDSSCAHVRSIDCVWILGSELTSGARFACRGPKLTTHPSGEQSAGTVSFRVQQLDVRVETKTKDNVFVSTVVS